MSGIVKVIHIPVMESIQMPIFHVPAMKRMNKSTRSQFIDHFTCGPMMFPKEYHHMSVTVTGQDDESGALRPT